MKRKGIKYTCIAAVYLTIVFLTVGCVVKLSGGRSFGYSVSGASTGGAQTAVIVYFQNRARTPIPSLDQKLTESLKTKVESQTSLKLVNKEGDVLLEGSIEDVSLMPKAVSGGNSLVPASNSLTVTIKVKYNNTKDPHFDYESTFSRSLDVPSNLSIDQVASLDNFKTLVIDQLTDDVFKKAFVNW